MNFMKAQVFGLFYFTISCDTVIGSGYYEAGGFLDHL